MSSLAEREGMGIFFLAARECQSLASFVAREGIGLPSLEAREAVPINKELKELVNLRSEAIIFFCLRTHQL